MKRKVINKRKKKSIFATFFKFGCYFGFCSLAVIVAVFGYFSNGLPDLNNLKTEIRTPGVSIQTYDGKIIGTYGDLYEDVVKIESLPSHVPAAFMAIEDKRFFQHFGIDFIGFFRAIYQNYISKKVVQGGSTITQQLAKNILICEGTVSHYDRSLNRKIKELLLAFWLEYKFSKKDIMMMYLNRVYFGAGTYGIDAAAKKYFEKPAKELTIFESAILAGLLKAPTKYSPSNHLNYAHNRAMTVLKAMEDQGYIKNAAEIEQNQGKSALSRDYKSTKNYMYYCDYAYDQAKKILGEIEDDVIVVTTFDEKKQQCAQEACKFFLDTEKDNYKFSQIAFVSMKRDGAVESMIGGDGYSLTQFNRVTTAQRLPGSAFKLFIYAAALEYGYQLDDLISDEPFEIKGWKPKNYKWKTLGKISVLDGFTYSVNAVSIRLAQAIGLKRVSEFAKKLGIYDVSIHDLSVALGTAPVTLLDLTAAYTTFMDGYSVWPYCVTEIRAKDGTILYKKEYEEKKQIIDEETFSGTRTLLKTVVEKGTGRAAKVTTGIFGKTGSNGNADACFIGFYDNADDKDNRFSFGAWVGNDNNKNKMTDKSTGGRIPARIVARFIKSFLDQKEKNDISKTEDNKIQKNFSNKSLGELLNSN